MVEHVLHGLNMAGLGSGHQEGVAGQCFFQLVGNVSPILKNKRMIFSWIKLLGVAKSFLYFNLFERMQFTSYLKYDYYFLKMTWKASA